MTATGARPASRLDDRYGRAPRQLRRRRLGVAAVVVALLLATAAWAVWTRVGGAASTIDVQTTGYTVHGDRSVTVGWVVSGDAGHRLVCTIEAQDGTQEVLGLKEVVVPVTGAPDRSGTTTVLTTREATTGLIRSCRRA
ncbi:MAG: hypothetical protein QOE37_1672 [Microbacteriaceae bacterium]|jgi:hypothetical protein|nr:hypothetical protein [Microbacteriaceae bacterium]